MYMTLFILTPYNNLVETNQGETQQKDIHSMDARGLSVLLGE